MSEWPFSQAVVVAHRGDSAHIAENTEAAFESAIQLGAEAVEFDVRMTADGAAVVLHDADVARTTDGTGLVRSMTLQQVRRLRIDLADGSEAGVPTLVEALGILSGRAAADIEIKNVPGEPDFDPDREDAVEATVAALQATAFDGPVIVSSFNPLSIARSKELAPDVATGLLTERSVEADAGLTFARAQGHAWVLPAVGAVLDAPEGFAERAHRAGMRVGTWISDDPDQAIGLMRSGIDAVATNDPGGILTARRRAFGA